jgi:hypothetical protein
MFLNLISGAVSSEKILLFAPRKRTAGVSIFFTSAHGASALRLRAASISASPGSG